MLEWMYMPQAASIVALDERHLGRGSEQHDGRELDGLVDQNLERMRAGARDPVHVGGGVVGLVHAPQPGRRGAAAGETDRCRDRG